jgi:hypothetical protein
MCKYVAKISFTDLIISILLHTDMHIYRYAYMYAYIQICVHIANLEFG